MNNPPDDTDPDDSLREIFGLPQIRTEVDAPPVEMELLEKLFGDSSIPEREFAVAMENLTRFAEWREAYQQVVLHHRVERINSTQHGDDQAPPSPLHE
ncbi:MAG: hypothetical protein AAGA30_08640 [Planctomycetota bacterium]